jgi:hypothetical protein
MSEQIFSAHPNPMQCASRGCGACNKQLGYNAGVRDALKEMYGSMGEFIEAAEQLLDWVPVCSVGSSGFLAQQKLRDAINKLRGVLA